MLSQGCQESLVDKLKITFPVLCGQGIVGRLRSIIMLIGEKLENTERERGRERWVRKRGIGMRESERERGKGGREKM